MAALAAELDTCLISGTVCEVGPGGELFNTLRFYGRDGAVLASYRRIFPWRLCEPYEPGEALVTFDLPGGGRIGLSVESSTSFINFGAFTAFTAVNGAAIIDAWRDQARSHLTFARRVTRVIGDFGVPLVGAGIDLWLLTRLETPALVLGSVWLAAGCSILLVLTNGLRRMPPALATEVG